MWPLRPYHVFGPLQAAKSCAVPAMLALLNGGASMTARDSLGDSVLSYSLR